MFVLLLGSVIDTYSAVGNLASRGHFGFRDEKDGVSAFNVAKALR